MSATHQSQLAPGNSAITKSSGCTWTSVANGISTITAGAHHPTPDAVHAEVKHSEETNPDTLGWSIPDAILAAKRMGYPLVDHSGEGWSGLLHALPGHYAIVQGDSDQFGNATCSGAFNGDHCIGIDGSRHRIVDGERWWWIDDSICPTGRWERESVIRRYAEKLSSGIRFAVFAKTVPVPKPKPVVTLRYGGKALPKPTVKVFDVADANVRARPATDAKVLNVRHRGGKWTAWQVTATGDKVGGSRRWFGNKNGRRWIHESVVR